MGDEGPKVPGLKQLVKDFKPTPPGIFTYRKCVKRLYVCKYLTWTRDSLKNHSNVATTLRLAAYALKYFLILTQIR